MARFGIFGWGIVAPKSPNIDAFARNLEGGESWLTEFDGFGPSTFLVGDPEFDAQFMVKGDSPDQITHFLTGERRVALNALARVHPGGQGVEALREVARLVPLRVAEQAVNEQDLHLRHVTWREVLDGPRRYLPLQ